MKFNAHPYQEKAIRYILDHPFCGLFLDMGLGKTVSTLTALQIIKDDYLDLNRVLIIAPKRVALDTWPQEIAKWDHIDLTYTMLTGSRREREEGLHKKTDLYITTRDLVTWLEEETRGRWPFDTVIIDELSSFKSSSAKRFKALRRVRPRMKRVIGLTGTPKPNSFLDLWPEIFLLDQGERLEKTVTKYRQKYFTMQTWGGFPKYDLIKGQDKEIGKKIKDICISMKAKDYLNLKEPMVIDQMVRLSEREEKLYRKMEKQYVLELEDKEITAVNGAALSGKLLQLANGAIYDENKKATVIHDAKIEALKEKMEEGENLLVFYEFQSDKDRILKAIPEAVALDGSDTIRDWNAGKIKMLIAHPASAGHGLNLQQGGHVIVWFGLNWSLELYEQANARLHRQGQKDPVIIYRLLTRGTLDESVAVALSRKSQSQEALLKALKARIKEYAGGARWDTKH